MSVTVTLKVTKENRYWVGVPDGYPGSCMGRSVMELMQEAQAILPYMTAGPDGIPTPDLVVDYVFTDVPVELHADIHRYRELAAQRRELDMTLGDLASRTVKDSAAVLGISRQWVNQLRNA
jgi:hypothetical protein